MNLPNKLTVGRVIMIPFVIAAIMIGDILLPKYIAYPIAALLFGLTSLTDMLDGKIARKYNLITDFGKFLDPLADKLLVIGTMLTLLYRHEPIRHFLFWAVLLVVFREFTVTGIRLIAATKPKDGQVIAASMLGKIKTVSQMVCLLVVLLEPAIEHLIELSVGDGGYALSGVYPLSLATILIMAVFTLLSGVDYFIKYKDFIKE